MTVAVRVVSVARAAVSSVASAARAAAASVAAVVSRREAAPLDGGECVRTRELTILAPGTTEEACLAYLEASDAAFAEDGLEQSLECLGDCGGADGAWVLTGGNKSQSCRKQCSSLGKTCNAGKMDEVDTADKMRAAMAEVGVACDAVKGRDAKVRKKAGVPGYKVNRRGENVCFPNRTNEGRGTNCKKNLGNFQSLCWCE